MRAGRAVRTVGCAVGLALFAWGCSARPSMNVASDYANRYAESFYPLEAWALRALAAETVPSSVDAFDGRLFAPMEGRADVVDAWLVRTGTSAATYSARGTDPPLDAARFSRVHMADRRELGVAVMSLDDPRTPEVDSIEVVVIARTTRPSALEEIQFAVAFTAATPH